MSTLRITRRGVRSYEWDGASMATILLCFAIIVPSRFVFPPLGGVGRADTLIGLGMFGWYLLSLLVPRLAPRGANPLRWALMFWLCSSLASIVAAYTRPLSPLELSGTERGLIGVFSNIGLILICSEGIRSRERVEAVLRRLTYLGGFLAFVGSVQFYVGLDLSQYLVPPGFGLNNDLFGVSSRSIFARVSGTSIHAIEYGAVLALILPLAVHFALHAKSRAESQARWALAGFIALSGMYSISRTNTIAVVMALVLVMALWTGRMRINALVVGLLSLVVVRAAIPGLLGTIRSLFERLGTDPSIQGRTNDYPIAFEYIAERPFFGRGLATWNAEEYFILDNNWLGLLLQVGWVGVAANAVMLLLPIFMARRILNSGRDDEWRHLAGVLVAQLVVIFTVSFFFDSAAFPQFRTIQMFIIGMVGAMWRVDQRRDPEDVKLATRPGLMKSTKSAHGHRHGLREPAAGAIHISDGR